MKTRVALLTLSMLWTACQPAPPPSPTSTGAAAEEPASTSAPPTATPRPTASPAPKSNRSAAFTLVENTVEARPSQSDAYAPASVGLTIPIGGGARTGEDGRARLDLSPDGTIVRVAPNTIFTLPALEEKDASPFMLIELFLGQIYILLSGGELQVQTPSGVAAVRGSMLGVFYNPDDGTMTATCLEGHCSLRNDLGIIELIAGQAADIRNGILSHQPRPLTDAELLGWLEYAPELKDRPDLLPSLRQRINNLPGLPNPPNLPRPRRPRLP